MMKINLPKLIIDNKKATYLVAIDLKEETKELYFQVDVEYAEMISLSGDAALAGLIVQAMYLGEDIEIDAPVSSELLYAFKGSFQVLMCEAIPFLNNIEIRASHVHAQDKKNGVATGFSGGVDSFSTLVEYLSSDMPEHLRLTHLVFNNVGSHGGGGETLFEERYARISPLVKNIGLPFIKCNSNLDEFYSKRLNFQLTHTVRNASAAMVLQNEIGTFLYSSAYGFSEININCGNDIAKIDPLSFQYLSSEHLKFISAGAHLYRVDKTIQISKYETSFDNLDVCVSSTIGNCSKCFKCLRTMLTFEICQQLEKYQNVFDLDVYKKYRLSYMAEVIVGSDSFSSEIRQFAKRHGFKFPLYAYLLIPFTVKALKVLPVIYQIRQYKKSRKSYIFRR